MKTTAAIIPITNRRSAAVLLTFCAALACGYTPRAAAQPPQPEAHPAPLARRAFRVGAFTVSLRRDTQTLAQLSPDTGSAFDFVPAARAAQRQYDGYMHIGDLNLRLRAAAGEWRDFSSAHARRPIESLPSTASVLAAADISATMGAGFPLRAQRSWSNEAGVLVLRFTLTNPTDAAVELGGLGMPMVFDNIISDRSLEQAHAQASFVDPSIGRDAGYLQVTRLNGKPPALLVLPEPNTPLEAYRPILDARAGKNGVLTDRSPRNQTSEGFYDWMVASKGFAETDWQGAGEQWNVPTSIVLPPGASRVFGLRFVLAPSIRALEPTLIAQGRPVAVGIPGYVLPTDLDGSLFVNSPKAITRLEVAPAGALVVSAAGTINGWSRYSVRGARWGQARLSITYADGGVQTVSYFVTKPLETVMADLGRFSTTRQWFDDPKDPFGRSPAILTFDRETNRIVTQEERVWIAGMSDEGGGGSWVAAMAKQLDHPEREEVERLERLMNETVVGRLQVAAGPHRGAVRKSLFYYDPKKFPGLYDPARDWSSWTSWTKEGADDLGRSYNYPHVAIGHWVLYRLARNTHGLVHTHDWRWYLEHAWLTTAAMMRDAPDYAQFGQMEGDVFVDILKDLEREGMTAQAREMRRLMRARAEHWRSLPFPFGSEMAWDSTGQAEVYAWMRFFGFQREADATRAVIEAYDPTLPSWGYNGNARRYWDFLYGGKLARIERQIHHYGSTLNAVPLFDAFRADPRNLRLLRVAYGGLLGGITNIDQEGFGSAAFHSAPDQMRWDPYSGDYGMGFFGHAYAAATYLVRDPTFGWLGFGGNVERTADAVRIVPRDGARRRLFVGGAWIVLEAGKIAAASYSPASGDIELTLDPADEFTSAARLVVETTVAGAARYETGAGTVERGARTIPLARLPTVVTLRPRR